MRTFFTWGSLLMASLLIYSACDSGVDFPNTPGAFQEQEDARKANPGSDLSDKEFGKWGNVGQVTILSSAADSAIAIIKGHVETLEAAYDSSGVTIDEIKAFFDNNDLSGAAEALGMTLEEATATVVSYQTNWEIWKDEVGEDNMNPMDVSDKLANIDPPVLDDDDESGGPEDPTLESDFTVTSDTLCNQECLRVYKTKETEILVRWIGNARECLQLDGYGDVGVIIYRYFVMDDCNDNVTIQMITELRQATREYSWCLADCKALEEEECVPPPYEETCPEDEDPDWGETGG